MCERAENGEPRSPKQIVYDRLCVLAQTYGKPAGFFGQFRVGPFDYDGGGDVNRAGKISLVHNAFLPEEKSAFVVVLVQGDSALSLFEAGTESVAIGKNSEVSNEDFPGLHKVIDFIEKSAAEEIDLPEHL